MGDLKYGEFEFPSDRGFSGSAGKTSVRGHMRGGHMKKARGGTVGVTTEPGPRSRKPKNTMTKAARGGHIHDKLMREGGKMGYAQGGYAKAKDTSGEFDMKSKPQPSMDHGTYPPQSTNQAEKEAGGRKRVKPKFKKGGGVHQVRMRNPDKSRGKGMSRKGVPKTVKAMGGLAEYAAGGAVTSPGAGHLGTGGARKAASGMKAREERVKSTVNEALRSARSSRTGGSPKPVARKHDKAPSKKGIYREDKKGVPTFTDVPKVGKQVKMAEGGQWIDKAIKKPGALRKSLGVKKGQKIPAKKLEAAAKKPGKMGQRARLAETLRKMN